MADLSEHSSVIAAFINDLNGEKYNVQGDKNKLIAWLNDNVSTRFSGREWDDSSQVTSKITLSIPSKDGKQELKVTITYGNILTYEIIKAETYVKLSNHDFSNSQNN
jgi:hypothetical protein